MPILQMICLANSRKHQGRCIAGLRTDGRGWIRPVGDSGDGALFPDEYMLQYGTEPQALDMLSIDVVEPRPEPHQPENWLIGRRRWRLLARPAPREVVRILRSHLARGPGLFGDESDRIPFAAFSQAPAPASLALVVPTDLRWRVLFTRYSSRPRVRACFTLAGAHYDLGVTDPICEMRLYGLPPGLHPLSAAGFSDDDRILLTISLGEPFGEDACCYKLVAGVTVVPSSWRR